MSPGSIWQYKEEGIMKTIWIIAIISVCSFSVCSFSGPAFSLCLKECNGSEAPSQGRIFPQTTYNSSSSQRDRSHNLNGVKNSIVGDVTITNGHNRVNVSDITGDTTVDASINSTIILGDMKQ